MRSTADLHADWLDGQAEDETEREREARARWYPAEDDDGAR